MISRRTDYDNKLAKVQKAKKEKPEWEEEMQAAKAKYEETRENVLTLMNTISDTQASQCKPEMDRSSLAISGKLTLCFTNFRMTTSQA